MISFFRKLGWLTRRRSKENQLTAELQFHLEEETEEPGSRCVRAGRALGGAGGNWETWAWCGEDTRAMWSWTLLEQLGQDLRYGARTILRNPAFHTLAAAYRGAGYWGEHGDLQLHGTFADAVVARGGSGVAGVLKWHLTGKKNTDNSVLHKSAQIYDDPRTGSTSAVFPFPAFEQLRKSSGALPLCSRTARYES